MNRLFSINRRRPNIVDLYTPIVAGVDTYRLKSASNFDVAFVTFLDSTNIGYLDPNVNRNVIETQPTAGRQVRIVFDPVSYGIDDTKAFWLQFVPVIGVIEGTPGAPTLVLPDTSLHGSGIVVIHGDAPAASPLQLDLPRRMEDFRVINEDGANGLFIGTEDGGPMITIPALLGVQNLGIQGVQGSLYVQGDGGDVPFSAMFTLAFPR